MLSFQEFQSVVTQKFPHCNWLFDYKFTVIGEEYFANITDSRIITAYSCQYQSWSVGLLSENREYVQSWQYKHAKSFVLICTVTSGSGVKRFPVGADLTPTPIDVVRHNLVTSILKNLAGVILAFE